MGLFQFIKDVGDKVSGKPDGKTIEEKIKADLGDQIIELTAEVSESEVALTGLCESDAAKEKAILIAGNTKGISVVNYFKLRIRGAETETAEDKAADAEADDVAEVVAEEQEGPSGETVFYTIVSGDTLGKLAKKYYGNAGKYDVIFEANREVIKDPNKIYVGQTIRIPKSA